jgi:hypothetical protein
MRSFRTSLLFLFSIAFISGCETNEPENNAQLKITVEETSCTEAWVKIEYTSGFRISLQRDGTEIANFKLTGNDTTIIDETLEPSKTYNYSANVTIFEGQIKSEASARTLDTTSHEFEWDVQEFGYQSSSLFFDVSVLNDDDIWAVGSIFQPDSNGNEDGPPFGIVRWDGIKWTVKRMTLRLDSGYNLSLEPMGVMTFQSNDIWFVRGSAYYYNGKNIIPYWLTLPEGNDNYIFKNNEWPTRIWGLSSKFLYVGGEKGALGFFDGNRWTKIETNLGEEILFDLWGYNDSKTNMKGVFYVGGDRRVYKLNNNVPEVYADFNFNFYISSVWMMNERKVYIVGDSLRVGTQGHWKEVPGIKADYMKKIRGNGLNDIFILDWAGNIHHFNGMTWKTMKIFGREERFIFTISVKGNTVATAGLSNNNAIVAVGRRK